MRQCKVRGPAVGVRDEWWCLTHDVAPILRNPSRFGAPHYRRIELACPVGQAHHVGDDVVAWPLGHRNDSGRAVWADAVSERREVWLALLDLGFEAVPSTHPDYSRTDLLPVYTQSFVGPLGRVDIHWGS
jgi:hypothetical protein